MSCCLGAVLILLMSHQGLPKNLTRYKAAVHGSCYVILERYSLDDTMLRSHHKVDVCNDRTLASWIKMSLFLRLIR